VARDDGTGKAIERLTRSDSTGRQIDWSPSDLHFPSFWPIGTPRSEIEPALRRALVENHGTKRIVWGYMGLQSCQVSLVVRNTNWCIRTDRAATKKASRQFGISS
jgi:hypothetical protein